MGNEDFTEWWEEASISYALLAGCKDKELSQSIKKLCYNAWLTSSNITGGRIKSLQKGGGKALPEDKDKGVGKVRMVLDVEGGMKLVLEGVVEDSEGNVINPPSPSVVFSSPLVVKLEDKG